MPRRVLVAGPALLLPIIGLSVLGLSGPALATPAPNAPPPSADQLVCDLTGQCGGADDAQPTQDKPATRGFSIARVGAPPAAATAPAAPAAAVASPARPRATHLAQTRPAPAAGRGGLTPRGSVGRSQLSLDFVSGSATLSDSDKAQADAFLTALANPAMSGKRFLISGHASAVGSRSSNLDLSLRRAQALVDYLASKGADRALFDVKGFGFDHPLPGTKPSSPVNRRVDLTTLN